MFVCFVYFVYLYISKEAIRRPVKKKEMKLNIVKGNEVVGTVNYSDLKSNSKAIFNQANLLSNNNGKHRFFTPKASGNYAFGGTYIDISSNQLLVDIYDLNMLPYHNYDLSKEKI